MLFLKKKKTCQVNADTLNAQFKIIQSFYFYATYHLSMSVSNPLCKYTYIYTHAHTYRDTASLYVYINSSFA